ncbi:MAG: (2Fe-2S) ferredoxin domain-containing protein [Clostridia bacterium]|nr:(2Fe-2S) ferredoxin domain-containing protein [Clostridia bacterium]
MKITVCIGSSCHIKGSRQVVEQLQSLIAEHGLKEEIDLAGTFCMGKCQSGVNVTVDGECFSVTPESTHTFFSETVLPRLK